MEYPNKLSIKPNLEFLAYWPLAFFIGGAIYAYGTMNNIWARPINFWFIIYSIKTGIEAIASGFVIFYTLVALNYRNPKEATPVDNIVGEYPNVLAVYLCCDDFEYRALESIMNNCVRYKCSLYIHDDSRKEESRAKVDAATKALQEKYSYPIRVIRRSTPKGGKPGALNNVIEQISPEAEFILVCDNDSFLPNSDFLGVAFRHFVDPLVALVQFRNVGQVFPEDNTGYKILSISIDFYDAFVSFMDRFGWSPFLGHNAILRVSAVRDVGGFTSDQLADDIDYSVKLRLGGYRIHYAREIASGERHPGNYRALRRRTRKWTYGCTQILLRWWKSVLGSTKLTLADKVTFFLTVGYYHFQLLLLIYLIIFYLFLPFYDPVMGGTLSVMFSACLILFFTFLPSITYFARNKILLEWPLVAALWGFTYGSQDFVMLEAVSRCVFRSAVIWTPTNGNIEKFKTVHFLPDIVFGILILIIAITKPPRSFLQGNSWFHPSWIS
jgi:cellulose synthase/poly-beta-1,6-N-acetylglucosamine synthase-like glycosyltransferase